MEWSEIMQANILQKGVELSEKADRLRRQGIEVYPPQDKIFRALKLTAPDRVKVCIIGQDPYHSPGAANGLAFSISPGRRIQPSLRNIFKELHDDTGCPVPDSGDLTPWARQGVLLLNTSLTVTGGQPGSHGNWGWDIFTGHIFDICLDKLPQPVVFILWGNHARRFADHVTWNSYENKTAFMSAHPSPLSANRGFFGSRPFSKTNEFLISHGSAPVDWSLFCNQEVTSRVEVRIEITRIFPQYCTPTEPDRTGLT